MKRIFFLIIIFCGLLPINSNCTNKEIKFNIDNPVKITTSYSGDGFVNEFIEASLLFKPKNGNYPMNYSLRYEQESGSGIYKLNDGDFTTEDTYVFNNAAEISINIFYTGTTEGKHKTKWVLENNYDQEFVVFLEFSLKKYPEPLTNEAPIANEDIFSTKEKVSITMDVLNNDTDKENDSLVITSLSDPANGTAVIENNKIIYTPDSDFIGTEIISYTIEDENENTATTDVKINVIAEDKENLPPVVMDDTIEIEINTLAVINVLENDSDPEGSDLTLVTVSTPANGIASIEGLLVKYQPNSDYLGNDIFEYTISDTLGNETTGQITIVIVGNPNNPPIAKDDFVEVISNVETFIDVISNDTDPENDELMISKITQAKMGIASIVDNKISYVSDFKFQGSETLTYTIIDNNGNEATAEINIIVILPPNDPPVANEDTTTANDNESIVIDVLMNDTDPDNDELSIISVENLLNGKAIIENQKIVYTANSGYEGLDRFNYTITDPRGNEVQGTVTITVNKQIIFFSNIPFEDKLVQLGIDTDNMTNGQIFKSDTDNVIRMNVSFANILQLDEIKYFVNLEEFIAVGNDLKEIDLSNNPKLKYVRLRDNELSRIKLNNLADLEFISVNINEPLTNIDLSDSYKLKILDAVGCGLVSANLSRNTRLEEVNLNFNDIKEIDFSNNINLKKLLIKENRLESLDLRNNIRLTEIDCQKNKLLSLDLSNTLALFYVKCNDNNLSVLNIKTSNRSVPYGVFAQNNPLLTCIQFSDVEEAKFQDEGGGYKYDIGVSFSENCNN